MGWGKNPKKKAGMTLGDLGDLTCSCASFCILRDNAVKAKGDDAGKKKRLLSPNTMYFQTEKVIHKNVFK